MKGLLRLLSVFVLIGIFAPNAWADKPKILQLKDLKPGTHAIGFSVFKGVELCTIYPSKRRTKKLDVGNFIKNGLTKMLLGNKEGLTIIGPATIVKQIKRDPRKIQLLIKTRRKR